MHRHPNGPGRGRNPAQVIMIFMLSAEAREPDLKYTEEP
jgi:hypothetical protein